MKKVHTWRYLAGEATQHHHEDSQTRRDCSVVQTVDEANLVPVRNFLVGGLCARPHGKGLPSHFAHHQGLVFLLVDRGRDALVHLSETPEVMHGQNFSVCFVVLRRCRALAVGVSTDMPAIDVHPK